MLKKLNKHNEIGSISFGSHCIHKLNIFNYFSEGFSFNAKLYAASFWKVCLLTVWFCYNCILICYFKLCCSTFFEICFNIGYFAFRNTNVWLITLVYGVHGNKVKGATLFFPQQTHLLRECLLFMVHIHVAFQ